MHGESHRSMRTTWSEIMNLSYAERTAKGCWIHSGDEDMDGEIRAEGGKYWAEIIASPAGPLNHVRQTGWNLRFLKSRGQIPPLRSRMRERCCLATKWILFIV